MGAHRSVVSNRENDRGVTVRGFDNRSFLKKYSPSGRAWRVGGAAIAGAAVEEHGRQNQVFLRNEHGCGNVFGASHH